MVDTDTIEMALTASKPLPAEVLIDAGQAKLIRTRQTNEDLIRGEMIPT